MGGCLIVLFSKWGRWEGDWPLFLSTSRTWERPRHAHRRHLKSKFCGGGNYCVYQWAEPPRPYWAVYGDNANIVEWWLTPCGRKVWSLNQAAVPPLRQFSGDFHAKCVFVVRQTRVENRFNRGHPRGISFYHPLSRSGWSIITRPLSFMRSKWCNLAAPLSAGERRLHALTGRRPLPNDCTRHTVFTTWHYF